jgi:IS30 family transposase
MQEIQQQNKNCEIKAHRQVAVCQIPKCLSCSENRGKIRPHKQHRGSITKNDNHPISNTSIDHVDASNVPGYTWQHKGRPTLKKYKNFMLFVDHKTRLVYPSFQESKTASEACRSKCDYETFTKRCNVKINSYHADNGSFRSESFQKLIDNKNHKLHFSGVNAQWQNGLVERSNGTLCAAARSMLNHAISRWDKTITAELWPFAIQHAATIYITTKRRSRDYELSPW